MNTVDDLDGRVEITTGGEVKVKFDTHCVECHHLIRKGEAVRTPITLEDISKRQYRHFTCPPDVFILVTIAWMRGRKKKGQVITHTWGPFESRTKAQKLKRKFQKQAAEMDHELQTHICKLLDGDDEDVPPVGQWPQTGVNDA